MAKTLPLPCVSTAFVAQTVPFVAVLSWARNQHNAERSSWFSPPPATVCTLTAAPPLHFTSCFNQTGGGSQHVERAGVWQAILLSGPPARRASRGGVQSSTARGWQVQIGMERSHQQLSFDACGHHSTNELRVNGRDVAAAQTALSASSATARSARPFTTCLRALTRNGWKRASPLQSFLTRRPCTATGRVAAGRRRPGRLQSFLAGAIL